MKTMFLVVVILLMAMHEISTARQRDLKLLRRNLFCSRSQPCPTNKFCLPFVSKCTGADPNVYGRPCYIDEQCPAHETCSIFDGYCLQKPSCVNTVPYSFCRKDFCPCPDGYKCQGEYNHQKCLPVNGNRSDGSEQGGSGEVPMIVVN